MFETFSAALILLVSYFLGCFNGAVMISRFIIRDDVREHGSGNAGLTNFYRTYGAKYALLVIVCDVLKIVIACLIGGYMFLNIMDDWTLGVLVGGLGCELGHIFPAFFGLRGGKGVLSGGVLVLMLNWRVALIAWVLFLICMLSTRYVSLGSIIGTLSIPITTYVFFDGNLLYTGFTLIVALLIVWCHRSNIQRLIHGNEKKFTWHVTPSDNTETQEQ